MRRRSLAVAVVAVLVIGSAVMAPTSHAMEGGRVLEGVPEADESFICHFEGMEPVLYRTEVEYVDGFVRIVTDADGKWVRGIARAVYDAVEFRLEEGSESSGAPDPVFVSGVQLLTGTFSEEGQLARAVLVVPNWELRDSTGEIVDSGRSIAHVDQTGTVRSNYTGACTDWGTGRNDP